MTVSPVTALRKAVRSVLAADTALATKLLNQPVHDEAPRGAPTPYLTFGDVTVGDWSTSTDKGAEQFLVVHAWSTQHGVSEAIGIAADVVRLLNDSNLSLEGHYLVNMRLLALETRRESNGRFARASARFRVVTEQNL